MNLKTISTAILALTAACILLCGCGVEAPPVEGNNSAKAPVASYPDVAFDGPAQLVVRVDGMACERNCGAQVRQAFTAIEGVEKVDIDIEKKTATVALVAGGHLDSKQLQAALAPTSFEYKGVKPAATGAAH